MRSPLVTAILVGILLFPLSLGPMGPRGEVPCHGPPKTRGTAK